MVVNGHFRSSKRPQSFHPVTIHIKDRDSVTAFTRDVSSGGVFILTDCSFSMGDRIEIELSSPSTWEPLRLDAEVCRIVDDCAENGIGVRFIGVTDKQLVALIDLISALDFES